MSGANDVADCCDGKQRPRSSEPSATAIIRIVTTSGHACGPSTSSRPAERPPSSARGVHHQALISSDVERTIDFYQGLLEFPLTELFQNRDYVGSTHFFFDIGNGNALAFFDFPGLGSRGVRRRCSVATTIWRSRWSAATGNGSRTSSRPPASDAPRRGGTSIYFLGPDGERLELIADPLGEMYGMSVL